VPVPPALLHHKLLAVDPNIPLMPTEAVGAVGAVGADANHAAKRADQAAQPQPQDLAKLIAMAQAGMADVQRGINMSPEAQVKAAMAALGHVTEVLRETRGGEDGVLKALREAAAANTSAATQSLPSQTMPRAAGSGQAQRKKEQKKRAKAKKAAAAEAGMAPTASEPQPEPEPQQLQQPSNSDPKQPPSPLAPVVMEALSTLTAFHKDESQRTLEFPAVGLSPEQRNFVRIEAGKLGYKGKSKGGGAARHLVINKPEPVKDKYELTEVDVLTTEQELALGASRVVGDNEDPACAVVFLRKIPRSVTRQSLQKLGSMYGKVVDTIVLHGRGQCVLQLDSCASASAMLAYYDTR
jgi:hypothetical protein